MATRRWGPWVLVLCAAAAACSLTVGKADLDSVACTEDNAMGPPACDYGQMCLNGRCTKCAALDLCGDGIDNDCANGPDDGCSGSGGNGGGSQGGTGNGGEGGGEGGQAGLDASDDHSAGGGSGQGGSSGGGQGGESGMGGDSGSGGAGGDIPDVVETGPVLKKIGEACAIEEDCESDLFCGPSGSAAAGKCTRACCTSGDCALGSVCVPGYAGSICVTAPGETGMNEPGQYCGENKECRSGRCEGNRCQDTCCVEGNCKNDHNCSLTDVNGLLAWRCTYWATEHQWAPPTPCENDSDCTTNVCDTIAMVKVCVAPCCGDTCNLTNCAYWASAGSAYRSCGGIGNNFEPCCVNSNCGSGKCVAKPAESYSALQCK